MKKIIVTLAALFAAAAVMSAQSMAEATETAKLANDSLSAGEYATALAGFKEALKMAEACGERRLIVQYVAKEKKWTCKVKSFETMMKKTGVEWK